MLKFALNASVEPQQSCLTRMGKCRSPILLAGLLLLIQGCATPPPKPPNTVYTEAKAAYLAHDYQRTLEIVGPRAIAGEAWAQYTLGYMYHYGQGVASDRPMAKQWIQRAANQGYAPARHALEHISSQLPPTDANIHSSTNEGVIPGAAADLGKQKPEQPPSQAMATTARPEASAPPPMPAPAASAMAPAGATQTEQIENGIKDHDWIAAQDPQQFTVQLIGFGNKMAAIHFIHDNHIEWQAAYYSTMRSGQPWFAVVYGKFASRDAAHQALERLPSALRGASPWIRSFRDIQALSAPSN